MSLRSEAIRAEPARRLANSSQPWRWLEWAIYGVVTLLIVVRFFTESIPVLPRFLNAIDLVAVPILLPLYLIWAVVKGRWGIRGKWIVVLSWLFVNVWLVSWLVNSREVHWLGALLLGVGLLTPIIFYLILINIGVGEKFCDRMLSLLIILLLGNLVVGTRQAAQGLGTGTPDFVFGTFGVNQNQMALFLAFMMMYLLAKWRFEGLSIVEIAVLGWASILFLLCGFQTLWVVLAVAIVVVFFILARISKRLVLIATMAALLPLLALPRLDFARFTFGPMLDVAIRNFGRLGKVELIRNVPLVWESRPWSFWFGLGPGTFNSRAFRSIAIIPIGSGTPTDVAGSIVAPFYVNELSQRFIIPYFILGTVYELGSDVGGPFTSYLSVPLETGLLGALCIFGIYAVAVWSLAQPLRQPTLPRQKTLAAWALLNMLVLLGIAVADNYLEVTRYTLLVWLSMAVWQIYSRVVTQSRLLPQSE